jgi:hypothetical protein
MRRWADLEAEKGELGDLNGQPQFSARWIFRQAWESLSIKEVRFFDSWIRLEMAAKNFGDQADNSPVYSARWALHERTKLAVEPDVNLLWSARIAAEEGSIGEFDHPQPGTAREIFRRLGGIAGVYDWIRMERSSHDYWSNVGKQFSAEWIFGSFVKLSTEMSLDEWLYLRQLPAADRPHLALQSPN